MQGQKEKPEATVAHYRAHSTPTQKRRNKSCLLPLEAGGCCRRHVDLASSDGGPPLEVEHARRVARVALGLRSGEDVPEAQRLIAGAGDDSLAVGRHRQVEHT